MALVWAGSVQNRSQASSAPVLRGEYLGRLLSPHWFGQQLDCASTPHLLKAALLPELAGGTNPYLGPIALPSSAYSARVAMWTSFPSDVGRRGCTLWVAGQQSHAAE